MKVVLAEKPSVAQSIARIVGATHKKNGFFEGNGWQVTYAFGHLIQLAMPENYGYNSWSKSNLPMLPKEFLLLSGNHQELLGQHRKVAFRPAVIAVVLWHGQLYQMSECVGHLPAVALEEAILLMGGSYDTGNALGNAGFLC